MIPPFVDTEFLEAHPEAVLADVRWYLDGRDGRAAFEAGHLPGAVWVDLDHQLAAIEHLDTDGRHPFPDPDAFDATRSNARSHLAFAQGPHACIGLHLARLETRAALTAVVDAWPGLAIESTATPPSGVIFRKPRSLPVRWDVAGSRAIQPSSVYSSS